MSSVSARMLLPSISTRWGLQASTVSQTGCDLSWPAPEPKAMRLTTSRVRVSAARRRRWSDHT